MPLRRSNLSLAIAAGIGAFAAFAAPPPGADRPHIQPVMELRPLAASEYELIIYGDIGESWWGESVTAAGVVEQLNALASDVTKINVRINSYGGSVSDGLAIYNALKRHKAEKLVTVDGVAMSSASLIAMAGDRIEMPETSMLMIHAPWGMAIGNAQELRQYADVLDTYADAMASAYAKKSGKPHADCLALLTDGQDHYFTGAEAVAEGWADAVVGALADEEPDEQARAFACELLGRFLGRAPQQVAQQAITAALRGSHAHPRQPTQPAGVAPNPAAAGNQPPADTAAEGEEDMRTFASARRRLMEPAGAASGGAAGTASSTASTTATSPAAASGPDAAAILAADRERRQAIRAAFAPFASREGVATLQQQCEDDSGVSAETASARLLAHIGTQQQPLNAGHRVEAGSLDETRTYREGAASALLHRANPAAHQVDERGQQFRGYNLVDYARDSLERAGRRTRGMSRNEIAVQALQSTSDFPSILENVITRTLRAGYDGTQRTFTPFCRRAVLPDFKQISRTQLGGAPSLKKVLEGAEYEQGVIGDAAEKYAVSKYGRIVAVTWEVIVNDDMDALTRVPQMFGRSAADLESDVVYAIITNNAALADGVALFHATHGNLGSAGAISETTLSEMREKMLLQTGIEGRHITVRPEFLVVPPKQLTLAEKFIALPIIPAQAANANPFHNSLQIIAEPRLQDASATAWYAAANPNAIDTIEYAYLEGNEAVFTETRQGFEVDGLQVKCRHVFGAKAIDYRGLFKNAGA